MSLLQATHDVTVDEIPSRGSNDLVRTPRIALLGRSATHGGTLDPATVRQLLGSGHYTRLPVPAAVAYRIQSGTHSQTGIVVEASVRDYREGRIRSHEATNPQRERQIDIATAEAGFEQLPVALTHPDRERLNALLKTATVGEPRLDVGSATESRHTVWVSQDIDLVNEVQAELGRLDTLYIVDGHHRMAAAERYSSRRYRNGAAFTLAALFPPQQLRVLGYSRRIARPTRYSTEELLAVMAGLPGVRSLVRRDSGERPEPGEVTVYIDGDWYSMMLTEPDTACDARGSLEAVRLDECVLPSLVTALGLDGDNPVEPVPTGSMEGLRGVCVDHDAIGFTPRPPGVTTITSVADEGRIMPPKSTWFDPKVSAGLFVREIG